MKAHLTPDMMAVYQTAVQYHLWHGLGLGLIGVVLTQWPDLNLLRVAGWLMLAGTILFCGSLYLLAMTSMKMLGAITPMGGVLLIAAWLVFAWAIVKGEKR